MSSSSFWRHHHGSLTSSPDGEHQLPAEPLLLLAYAAGLHEYGEARLERSGLHAWMVQRLMVDGGVDHAEALRITDRVIDDEAARGGHGGTRRVGHPHRPRLHRVAA